MATRQTGALNIASSGCRMRTIFLSLRALLFVVVTSPFASAAEKPLSLRWEDLMPVGEEERLARIYEEFYGALEKQVEGGASAIAEGGPLDDMRQLGTFNVVDDLDGRLVRIPGFVVPLDFDAVDVYSDFLLVPYFGACIHVPPPPPNQIVYVRVKKPVRMGQIWQPFWIEGVLSTDKALNELGDAAYTMEFRRFDPF